MTAVDFACKIPGLYSRAELAELHKLIEALPDLSTVVEIGVLYGRSASIFLQATLAKKLCLHLVDNWCVSENDTWPYFTGMIHKHFEDVPLTLHSCVSVEAWHRFNPNEKIDLLHIDGNHTPMGIQMDCKLWMPLLRAGGVAVFHDYALKHDNGRLVYPQISETVDYHCKHTWELLGVTDTQARFRKT